MLPCTPLTFTPELLLAQLAELLAAVPVGPLASSLARLDRVRLEVIGQPAEVAVAEERIFAQMTLGSSQSQAEKSGGWRSAAGETRRAR